MNSHSRRRVLRGMLNGGAVTLALPLLNCWLNGNGTALANGLPMPVRYGSWFWGLGMQAKVFVPEKTGRNYDLPEEISAFAPIQDDMNLFTRLNTYRDAAPDFCHTTGWVVMRAGGPPATINDRPGETVDITIANQIGRATRFSQLTATAIGDVRNTMSYESVNAATVPEAEPLQFYQRLFGPDFSDPNAKTFTPNPRIMVRKSVLSGVMDHTKSLMKQVGVEDKARLDEYFTGLRHLELQLAQRLSKPKPVQACHPMDAPPDFKVGVEVSQVSVRHRIMTDMLAMAVACDQTRVFNMFYAAPQSRISRAGYERPHHTSTHEEGVDEVQGCQPMASWFTRRAMEEWVYFVQAFKSIKEGDGTLLDNVFITADSEVGYAKIHSLDGMAAFTAGRAGGKVRTGFHIDGDGRQGTSLGLTAMRVMGVDKASWGVGSNLTSKVFSEILA